MKLTREQVSQLSDVELNLAMTWFYSGSDKGLNGRYIDGELYYNMGTGRIYEYLTDYNLTMPLSIKNSIDVMQCFNGETLAGAVDHYTYEEVPVYKFTSLNDNPLRAICEVLLMIAMEREE